MNPKRYERLLAKSHRADRADVTLSAHLHDTERSAVALFGPQGRWGRAFPAFFRLDAARAERWLLNLRVASLFHDIGKANGGFMAAMEGSGSQSVRHEHLSALVLCLPAVRSWLRTSDILDADAITAAVLSHHLKASESGDRAWGALTNDARVRVFFDHAEVRKTLARVADVAGLSGPPPALPTDDYAPDRGPWPAVLEAGRRLATRWRRGLTPDTKAPALALKAGLIAADSVASALVRTGHDLDEWITDVVHRPPIDGQHVQDSVIAPRQRWLGSRFKGMHRFQTGAAQLGPRALLVAPCGSGKTLAAWEWARAEADRREVGRVVFLYPTRGTATEGFRDYVGWAPEGEGALVHGTARFELDAMSENPPDSLKDKRLTDEASARLFALGLWKHRYFSATVDQFLGFMEHSYTSLCLLPALADALVVVDEVHSFDGRMFEDFVQFLETFDVPVLAMTATLPRDRTQRLRAAGLRLYPNDDDLAGLGDLEVEANHPRYRIERVEGSDAALAIAEAAWRDGLRVLWVVNTVDRCQQRARDLAGGLSTEVLVYHSRFRLMDRKDAHARVVSAFQRADRRAVAVTTQVCEMSLDLDADVLITETAPVTALVQRFGRVNRNRRREGRSEAFLGRVCVYPPDSERPYERRDLEAAQSFLAVVAGEASQAGLAASLMKFAPKEDRGGVDPPFLGSGYYATAGSLRETDEIGRPCVLDRDLGAVLGALARREPIDGWVLTVPRRHVTPGDVHLPRYLGVAAAEHYTAEIGFSAPRST